jgi:hypothetical protein
MTSIFSNDNPSIINEYIKDKKMHQIDFVQLSTNKGVSYEVLSQYKDYLYYDLLSKNPNRDALVILKDNQSRINYENLSANLGIYEELK